MHTITKIIMISLILFVVILGIYNWNNPTTQNRREVKEKISEWIAECSNDSKIDTFYFSLGSTNKLSTLTLSCDKIENKDNGQSK